MFKVNNKDTRTTPDWEITEINIFSIEDFLFYTTLLFFDIIILRYYYWDFWNRTLKFQLLILLKQRVRNATMSLI